MSHVIRADFGTPPAPRPDMTVDFNMRCEILHCDEYATLVRVTTTCGPRVLVSHVFREHG